MANERQLKVTLIGDASGVQKAFKDADSAGQSFGLSVDNIAGGIGKAAGAIGVAIGGIAVVTESVGREMENERLGDKLAAQLNLTSEESAKAGEVAGRLYAGAYGASMEEVNNAIKSVGLNISDLGNVSESELEGITAKALDLASAFDKDVNEVTRAAGSLMKNGLAKDATEAFDLITAGFQAGADKGDDFTDTIDEYSPLFKALGLDGQEAFGLLSQGMQAGARNSDFLADALKEFQIRAVDGSKTSADAYKLLGLNAEQMTAKIAKGGAGAKEGLDQVLDALRNTEDPVKRNAAAVGLFGTKAEDLAGALFALDPSGAVAALGEVDDAATNLGDTLNNNFATKWESFKRQLSSLPGEIASIYADIASGDTEGAAAAFGELLGLNDEQIDAYQRYLDILRGAVAGAVEFFQEKLGQAQAFVADVMPAIEKIISAVILAIETSWRIWGEDLFRRASAVFSAIKDFIDGILRVIGGVIRLGLGVITGDWRMALDGLKGIAGGLFDSVRGIINAGMNLVVGIFEAGWNVGRSVFSGGVNNVISTVRELPGRIRDAVGNLGDLLRDAGRRLLNGLIAGISDRISDLREKLRGITELIPQLKGPPAKDEELLRPAGRLIMGGLVGGINDGEALLAQKLREVTGMVTVPFTPGGYVGGSQQATTRHVDQSRSIHIDRLEVHSNNADDLIRQLENMTELALPVAHPNL